MAKRADDFPIAVKRELANRVGLRSRPGCDQVTSAPHSGGKKALNVGVAAHITAASKKGPRYDKSLTSAQRKAIDNGIWLCSTCGTLVDADEGDHTVEQLREWRAAADLRRHQELRGVADAQAQRRGWRNQFRVVTTNVEGRTVHLSWHGLLDRLETLPTRTVEADELAIIHCLLARHEAEPVQPGWEEVRDAAAMDVLEVDADLTTKRRLRSPHMRNAQDFLRVWPRRNAPVSFCGRCGKVVAGVNCVTCQALLRACQ